MGLEKQSADGGADSRKALERLRQLVETDEPFAEGLDHYCILLGDPSEDGEWTDCPPRIGEPFAADGTEHEFSLLDDGAVVLYTPLSDTPYVVVGADMREFLALLLDTNGSGIGGLGYSIEDGLEEIPQDFDELEADELHVLETLRREFGVTRWPEHRERLEQLQALLPDAGS